MPRKFGVYKTIKTMKVNVLVLDIEKEKTFNQVFIVPKYYEDNLLNYIRKNWETDALKIANIKEIIGESETQYFLSYQDFINNGDVIK